MSPEPTDTQPVLVRPPVEMPDLKKESVFFATATRVGLGAIVAAGITLALTGIGISAKNLSGGRLLENFSFKEGLSRIVPEAIIWGGLFGLFGLVKTTSQNDVKANIRPYVEKLEQERESLVKDIVKNNSR